MQEEFNFWFWKRRELFLVTICYLYFTLKQLIIREEGPPNMLMLRVGWLFSKSVPWMQNAFMALCIVSFSSQVRGNIVFSGVACINGSGNAAALLRTEPPLGNNFRLNHGYQVTCHKVSRPSRQITDQDIHANITGYHRYQNVSDGNNSRVFWVSSHVLQLCYFKGKVR